ncbi:MAG: class I SAM-dependent methyltransferase [Betaproteobacteria bacterium]|nr:class I SAM-dependent methyltransferase [Betaproteobacteria bacterium]
MIVNETESTSPARRSVVDLSGMCQTIGGYGSLFAGQVKDAPDTTTDEYAADQELVNSRRVTEYLVPLAKAIGAHTVLDVGCGVGAMVRTFLGLGYEAYGVDLPGLHRHWSRLALPQDQMFIVDPAKLRLPFATDSVDFAYTLGVIEHVGTSDGMADRLSSYDSIRKEWLRELFRVVRPGGAMLVAGPNRHFPIDVAHGPDSRATAVERWLSEMLKASVHKVWGQNFLWSYGDVRRYLQGLPYQIEPQPIAGFLSCSRVPSAVRPAVQAYIDHLPRSLLGTGFNPWVMALVHKLTKS